MHLRKFEVFSFNHGSNLTIVLGFTQLFRCERENVRWGFYKREKKIKMKNWIFHPRWEGAGSTEFQILYCFFFLHWRERARFPSQELRGDFLAMAFLAFRACFLPCIPFLSRFLGKDFWFVCARSWTAISRRDFRVCILFVQFCFSFSKGFSARFLQRGSSTFPSVRFQLASFQQGFVCVCVCVLVLQCPWGFFWGSISSLFP
jgi:hypothetical protein